MQKRISRIENSVQDKNSPAWKKLCEYVDLVAENGSDEFTPREYLGNELFEQIHTLPQSISKLKKVTKISLYGSQLKRIPPEIGEMQNLTHFDPYTSYNLHWFPYEITKCKKLIDSRISTRALYGNYKYRNGFPKLNHNPVRYENEKVNCSICEKEMEYIETEQFWVSLNVGTDVIPLLVNVCSAECKEKIPKPSENYVQFPHKGGADLKQPLTEDELWEIEMEQYEKEKEIIKAETKFNISDFKPLKLIRYLMLLIAVTSNFGDFLQGLLSYSKFFVFLYALNIATR